MAKSASVTKKKLVKDLKGQMKKLQSELEVVKKASGVDEFINVKVQKTQSRFERIKNPNGADQGIGRYLLVIDINSKKQDVYIPVSIASGKKTTGFMYQIEGTSKGAISTTDISCRGEGATQITLGTLLYCKIPAGKKASFRIQFEIKGKIGKAYKIIINRINYKLSPSDVRYKQYLKEVISRNLEFR
jgi:hypothetical protein